MKRHILLIAVLISLCASLAEGDEPADINKLLYQANAHYEKGEYSRAIEEYIRILDGGLESGNLYYNIGNSFLKLGKTGYAILCYERAKRCIPADSDLKSNLNYARSFVDGEAFDGAPKNIFIKTVTLPFRNLSLNSTAIFCIILYAV